VVEYTVEACRLPSFDALDDRGRPILDPLLSALVSELAEIAPRALGHADPSRILFVFGAARREARASIRPLTFGFEKRVSPDKRWRKPMIAIEGREMLYEICLRPRYFLESTPAIRLRTIVHELLHISPRFDGTLDPLRRHEKGSRDFDDEVDAIATLWERSSEDRKTRAMIALLGEARLRAWTSRPPSRIPARLTMRAIYDARDLHEAVVIQR
jgi:hypothetical protein